MSRLIFPVGRGERDWTFCCQWDEDTFCAEWEPLMGSFVEYVSGCSHEYVDPLWKGGKMGLERRSNSWVAVSATEKAVANSLYLVRWLLWLPWNSSKWQVRIMVTQLIPAYGPLFLMTWNSGRDWRVHYHFDSPKMSESALSWVLEPGVSPPAYRSSIHYTVSTK